MTTDLVPTVEVANCPSWCIVGADCVGEHFADPGSLQWPSVRPSAWPLDNSVTLAFSPTWGEIDGLEPAVALYLSNLPNDSELTLDFTMPEALDLLVCLTRSIAATQQSRATRSETGTTR